MDQVAYDRLVDDFEETCNNIIKELMALTGRKWVVAPKGALRTMEEQHGLFMQPHDGKDNDHDGKIDEPDELVTKADAGSSPHNFDLARDIVPVVNGKPTWNVTREVWNVLGKVAKKYGLIWGGDFKSIYDAPHVEHASWRTCRTAWKQGELKLG
jgi:hypothetical protein